MVWVRITPDSTVIAPVTTSASCSWSGTRTIATKSHSPVTEYASATPSMSASSPPSFESASRSASIKTTAWVIVMALRIISTAARAAALALPARGLQLARLQAAKARAEQQAHHAAGHTRQPAGLRFAQREGNREQQRSQRARAEQIALVVVASARGEQVRPDPRSEQPQRSGVGAEHDRGRVGGDGGEGARHARGEEQREHHRVAVTALKQPAEDRHHEQGHELIEAVDVGELAGDEAPPVTAQGPDDPQLLDADEVRPRGDPHGAADRDQGDRHVGRRDRRIAGPAQEAPAGEHREGPASEPAPREPAQRPAPAALEHVLARQLRSAAPEAVPAVRALGDVGGYLRAAPLAHH